MDIGGAGAVPAERLARLGQVGAEEVTDAIATCFSALLGVAYGAGRLTTVEPDALSGRFSIVRSEI